MSHEHESGQPEGVMSSLGPDILAPDEFLGTLKRSTPLEAEKRLLLAVFKDALYCFHKYCGARSSKGQRLFSETEAWIAETSGEWVFSFENICESFGWNPNYIRRGLAQWKQNVSRRASRDSVSSRRAKKKLPRIHKLRMAA